METWDSLVKIAEKLGYRVETEHRTPFFSDIYSDHSGSITEGRKLVAVEGYDPKLMLNTLAHEVGHAVMGPTWLARACSHNTRFNLESRRFIAGLEIGAWKWARAAIGKEFDPEYAAHCLKTYKKELDDTRRHRYGADYSKV